MKRNSLLFFLTLYAFNLLQAQNFNIKAGISKVPASGFYKISVNPDLSAHAKADLSHIRIVNQQNKQTPYIVQQGSPSLADNSFRKLHIISNVTDKKNTVLTLENKTSGTDQLYLLMANTAVERYASVSGSNDQKNWFIIDDQILLHNSDDQHTGHFFQTIQFPFSRYAYLKLEIHNEHTDPLNILECGTFTNVVEKPVAYQQNPEPAFSQKDSNDGSSYIFITNKEPYLTERISYLVKGPKFFNRPASVFAWSDKDRQKQLLASTTIYATQSSFTLNPSKDQKLLLMIENGDNPPLRLISLYTEQPVRYLVSYLEANEEYKILADNMQATAPIYDHSQFKHSIPKALPSIRYTAPVPAVNALSIKPAEGLNQWLWPMIIAGIFVLGFLTFKLVKDIRQNESSNKVKPEHPSQTEIQS